MTLLLEGLLVLAVVIGSSIVGALIVRRLFAANFRHHNREAADPVWAIAGGAFGLLLGFMVVILWEDLQKAQDTVQAEANDITNLYQLTFGMPEWTDPRGLRDQIRRYTELLVKSEWPALGRHEASPEAEQAIDQIWKSYMQLQPAIRSDLDSYGLSLQHLSELQDARNLRINEAENRVPRPLWVVLLGGTVIVIGMAWFTGSDDLSTHLLTTAVLAISLAAILFLIRVLNNPFQGEVRADAKPMERALTHMREP